MSNKPTIAVIGGTGAEGSGLAVRWAANDYPIVIGSRSSEKATATAAELSAGLSKGPRGHPALIRGATNAEAASAGEIVVLSVPYDAQVATIDQIKEGAQGKLVITVVVPLKPPRVATVWRPPGGSAAQEAQAQLGEGVSLVSAFHNISAIHLKDLNYQPDCDVLVTGDDREAKQMAIKLANIAGFYGIDAGPLENSSVVEGLTSLLIGINVRHKVKGAGVRITGLPREVAA
jgi:NADPH-dependent F420 reductase